MCSKVLNGHIILTDTSITTILAPEMTYTPISTTAVDGQIISLSGGIEQDGENRQGAAIGLGVGLGLTFLPLGGFFFLCLKGEKVDIPAGTTIFGVTVTDNYDIDIY